MLSVRHLSVGLNNKDDFLHDISFSVGNGEIAVIIGPNGAGKSLLLRLIADGDVSYQGEVIANHFDAKKEPEKSKLQIGYSGQELVAESYLTGFEYLELVGAMQGMVAKEKVERILSLARALGCLNELYGLMERQSLATWQKVQLIASLLNHPAILLWDEPLHHLDQNSQKAVLGELNTLRKGGKTILIATNNLELAEQLADQVIILNQGEVVAQGTIDQLSRTANVHTKHLASIYTAIVNSHG